MICRWSVRGVQWLIVSDWLGVRVSYVRLVLYTHSSNPQPLRSLLFAGRFLLFCIRAFCSLLHVLLGPFLFCVCPREQKGVSVRGLELYLRLLFRPSAAIEDHVWKVSRARRGACCTALRWFSQYPHNSYNSWKSYRIAQFFNFYIGGL